MANIPEGAIQSSSESESGNGNVSPTNRSRTIKDRLHQCYFQHPICQQPRTMRPDGTLHMLCDDHRRKASHTQRRQHKRDRLLRMLTNALHQDSENETDRGQRRRCRPRLVLLGNQGALILGVVLSERGDLHDFETSMP